MRQKLIAGLVALLPLAITVYFVHLFVDIAARPLLPFASSILTPLGAAHPHLLAIASRLMALALLFLFITALGLCGRSIVIRLIEKLLEALPLVKTLYTTLADAMRLLFGGDVSAISGHPLVAFPSSHSYALSLEAMPPPPPPIAQHLPKGEYAPCFIPTSPHPISGFLVLTEKGDRFPLDLQTDELFTLLLSAGLFMPRPEDRA
jgi:uncharacterized membrane protein